MLPMNRMTGIASADLGLNGSLQREVADETEEQRKKRLQLMQDRAMTGMAGTGSPAAQMLFGGFGADR